MRAKKVAVSGGLTAIWGFCCLGGHFSKLVECYTAQNQIPYKPAQNLHQKITATVRGICFILKIIALNWVPFWTIYPLKLMFLAISASCIIEDCHVFSI